MKKILIFVSLLLLLLISTNFILAEATTPPESAKEPNEAGITNKAKQITGSLDERTQNILKEELTLPEWLGIPAKLLIGIGGTVTLEELIILVAVWIGFFIIIIDILGIFVIFSKYTNFIIAFAITTLISISGALRYIAQSIVSIAQSTWQKEGFWKLVIMVAIIIGVFWLIKLFMSKARTKKKLLKAEETGKQIAQERETAKKINEAAEASA